MSVSVNPQTDGPYQDIGQATAIRSAGYYGVYAGTSDMTAQMTLALNASFNDGVDLILPPGTINISGEILVNAAQSQIISTAAGAVNWRMPIGVRGYGPLATTIVQNTAGIRHFYYLPSSGNNAHVRFADFCLQNVSASYTNANQAGLQVGGGTASCTQEGIYLHNVSGRGLYAVCRVDDCTGLYVSGTFQNGLFRYYVEGGYNSDMFCFDKFYTSFDHPQDVGCSSSTGTTITGISSAVTPFIYPGMGITGSGVPADTTVSTVGTTSITVSNSVTAVTAFCTHLGTMLSLLQTDGTQYSGSGFATVANAANYYNKTRASNPNVISFRDVLFNRAQSLVEDYGSSYALSVRQLYMERAQRIAKFWGTGLKALAIDGIFLSQPQTLRQNWIEIVSSVPNGYIRNITSDGSPNAAVAVNIPNMGTSSEVGPFVVENAFGNVATGGGPTLSVASRKVVLGSLENGTAIYTYATGGGDANFDGMGVDIVEATINGSGANLVGPNSVQVVQYRKLRVIFVSNSNAATFTLASKYKKSDGTNWGTITTGAVGTKAALDFTSLGNGSYISAQASLAWA